MWWCMPLTPTSGDRGEFEASLAYILSSRTFKLREETRSQANKTKELSKASWVVGLSHSLWKQQDFPWVWSGFFLFLCSSALPSAAIGVRKVCDKHPWLLNFTQDLLSKEAICERTHWRPEPFMSISLPGKQGADVTLGAGEAELCLRV